MAATVKRRSCRANGIASAPTPPGVMGIHYAYYETTQDYIDLAGEIFRE